MSERLFNEVKIGLKDYLINNSQYDPLITSVPNGEKFPNVVIEYVDDVELSSDTYRFNVLTSMPLEINIFAKEKTVKNKRLSGRTIAREIEDHIKKFMGDRGFVRTMSSPTPNIDKEIYRITMRYDMKANERLNVFL